MARAATVRRRSASRAWPLASAAVLSGACSSVDVPAHEIDVVLDYDGATVHAVVAFPDHDEDEHESCSKGFMGGCSSTGSGGRVVSGDERVSAAQLRTTDDGASRTYDVYLRRNDADRLAWTERHKQPPDRPSPDAILCRVYETELGQPKPCNYSTRACTITIRVR